MSASGQSPTGSGIESGSGFTVHTLESAPPAARRGMHAVAGHLGYLPAAVGLMAESPQLLAGWQAANAAFEAADLDPLARETLVMTLAVRNGCHLCVAMHTARLRSLPADPGLVADLRAGRTPSDPRLAAVTAFTLAVLAAAGGVDDATRQAFLAAGFTRRNALEIVLGIGVYTISTFANRLTAAPIDAPLAAFA
jgi:AhpD family alkylhydroperoxidase